MLGHSALLLSQALAPLPLFVQIEPPCFVEGIPSRHPARHSFAATHVRAVGPYLLLSKLSRGWLPPARDLQLPHSPERSNSQVNDPCRWCQLLSQDCSQCGMDRHRDQV